MNVVKRILFILIGIVVLLLLVALFVKKEYAIEREVTINKPKAEVFNYVKFLKNQDNFSVWKQADPTKKVEFRGTDGTVGFVYAWDSQQGDHASTGEQEILSISEGERMDMALRFTKPFEANDRAYFVTSAEGENQTKVKWGFNGKMNYPMNMMLLFMNMDEMMGGDMQKGLDNLKGVLEK